MDWWQAIAAVLTALWARIDWQIVAALLAAVSAFGAFYAAWTTKQAAQAEVLLELLRFYSSTEMSRALRTLRQWHHEHGAQFVADWAAAMATGNPQAAEIDRARRLVISYFQDVDALRRARLISKHTMGVAVDKAGVGVLVHICSPLERALNPRVNLRFIARVIALVPAHRRELMTSVPIGGIGGEPEP